MLVPLTMILLGYKWKDNPPKDRQGFSGYRTTMSRINDETWKYAHRYWGRINLVLEIILAIVSFVVIIIMRSHTNFEIFSVYLVFIQLGILALTLLPTEFLLKEDGEWLLVGDTFEEYRKKLNPMRSIDHSGEVAEYMMVLSLNELGRSFLNVEKFVSQNRPYVDTRPKGE